LEHKVEEDGTFLYRYKGEDDFKRYETLDGKPRYNRRPRDPGGSRLAECGPEQSAGEAARQTFGQDAVYAMWEEEETRYKERGYVKVGSVQVRATEPEYPVFIDPSKT